MLTEQFIASVGAPSKAPAQTHVKDAGIFVHEYQPLKAQKTVLKKSATAQNCLAVSSTHIFAAQSGKAVVHVYNRERGNQEATVPFTDRITSVALACQESTLILGTTEGRIFLWEIAAGRQITTPSAHLQEVTSVKADPTSNFLLSASEDSTAHVWSIPQLLSFSNPGLESLSPLRTFASHKAGITALELGHGSAPCNFAVTASRDRTIHVWDYFTTNVLRTFLLSEPPLALALDPADRAIYVGQSDGGVQPLSLIAGSDGQEPAVLAVHNGVNANTPHQAHPNSLRKAPGISEDPVLSLGVSFDGSVVISGHESGVIRTFEVGRGGSPVELLQLPLPAAVTNLFFLPVTGFARQTYARLRLPVVTKPKFGAFDTGGSGGFAPDNYMLHAELPSSLAEMECSRFQSALRSTSFPLAMLDTGLNELLSWSSRQATHPETEQQDQNTDFMAFEAATEQPSELTPVEQISTLKTELEALRRLQRASFDKIDKLNAEKKALIRRQSKTASEHVLSNGTNHVNALDPSSDEG